MIDSLISTSLGTTLPWTSAAMICAVGIVTACARLLETDEARTRRAERKRTKELRMLADRISNYGRKIHHNYPTGDVVVSAHDLAEQLRKRPDTIASALDILLAEQKVQKAALDGYWRLNV